MSARDRLMLMGIAVVAVLGAVWMLAVSPARQQASKLSGEVSSTRSQLSQAQAEAAEARTAQQRYRTAYASLASLGQAVPTSPEVPSLVYALDQASNHHKVEFSSIATNASSGGSAASPSPSSASSPPASSPFTQMPFTFTFTGGYGDLIHLLTQLEDFTVQSTVGKGALKVSGRLLTIQTITLGSGASAQSSSTSAAATHASDEMTWTIAASAYVLAPSAVTPGSPAGGSGSSGATPGAPTGTPAAAATPAVIRANG